MSTQMQTKPTDAFRNVAGAIFDLDGTLADTLEDIAAGVNHALAAEGLPLVSPGQVRGWVGEGYRVLMERAAPSAGGARLDRLIQTGTSYYTEHALDRTHLYTGMFDVLKTLEAKGLRIAVLSNKPEPITIDIVRRLCLGVEFDAIVGYRDEAGKKPNPALALEIAARMSLPVDRIVLIGDSATDIATGRNAGMRVISVTWGFRSREQLEPAQPDALVDQPGKILSLLGLKQ
jgi:phosphoglycolate phosphatase